MNVTIDGVEYECTADGRELTFTTAHAGSRIVEVTPPILMPINVCPTCHRADWRPLSAATIDEAVELGWLTPAPTP